MREFRAAKQKNNYKKEVLAKPLGARTSCPQIIEKCRQNACVPGKTGGFARTSKTIQKSRIPGETAETRHVAVAIVGASVVNDFENSQILQAFTGISGGEIKNKTIKTPSEIFGFSGEPAVIQQTGIAGVFGAGRL